MGCYILFAGIREEVVGRVMTEKGTQGALCALRKEEFISFQPIINGEKFSTAQGTRGPTPPFRGCRRNFRRETVRKDPAQFGRNVWFKSLKLTAQGGHPGPNELIVL